MWTLIGIAHAADTQARFDARYNLVALAARAGGD